MEKVGVEIGILQCLRLLKHQSKLRERLSSLSTLERCIRLPELAGSGPFSSIFVAALPAIEGCTKSQDQLNHEDVTLIF